MRKPHLGIHYSHTDFRTPADALMPMAFSDSDHARDATRKSRSGTVIFVCRAPLYWRSALQPTIELESTPAEIDTVSGFPPSTIPVVCDSKPSVSVVTKRRLANQARHIDVRHLWIREYDARRIIHVQDIPGTDNPADYLTKVLKCRATEHVNRFVQSLAFDLCPVFCHGG